MWVIVWYDDGSGKKRWLGQVKQKINGEVEVRCLEKPFGMTQIPQSFEEEKHHCFYSKVYSTSVKPAALFHKRAYMWIY